MKEGGIVIFEDGEILSFGKYVPPDHPQYHNIPGHEESFKKEIVPNMHFKFLDHNYNNDLSFYHNALLLSLAGVIMIINNQQSISSPTEVLCYVPMNATEEQIRSLEESEKILSIGIQKIYAFNSYDFDDNIEFKNFSDYIKQQKNKIQKS